MEKYGRGKGMKEGRAHHVAAYRSEERLKECLAVGMEERTHVGFLPETEAGRIAWPTRPG